MFRVVSFSFSKINTQSQRGHLLTSQRMDYEFYFMAPCHTMFKHTFPDGMYESRGLFSKLFFLCDTQPIVRYIKLYV